MMNNFQIITSLGEMRLQHVRSREARTHLKWMLERIAALALLHRHLASRESGVFKSYLQDIQPYWSKIVAGRNISIFVDVAGDPAIPAGSASTVALITHELLTNCVEHAFGEADGGAIAVALKSNADMAELSITDNGRGLPSRRPARNPVKGLGLVESLAALIGGSFTIEARNPTGTRAVLIFPR